MPRTSKELYRRGKYWLAWDRKRDGSLRSPYLAVFWYDPERRRERSFSTRTSSVDQARLVLDAHYLKNERGQATCPTCGQLIGGKSGFLLADAIANYLIVEASSKPSENAIRARLTHVVNYIETLAGEAVRVEDVGEDWIAGFRRWAATVPVQLSKGKTRERATGTIEASVRALAAAINAAHKRGDVTRLAQFKPLAPSEVSRTPLHRSSVPELAKMFAYVLDKSRAKRSVPLHRYLVASVATLARPDAVLDLSTKAEREQWHSERRVLDLNPKGRRQTKKYRATVKAPWQFARWLDSDSELTPGPFVPVASIKHAWKTMTVRLGLPAEGESGPKLIRRSMAQLLRERGVPAEEVEMQMGHRKIKSTTELYAPFQPEYLANATKAIEGIIDEIEQLVPGAFYRTCTGDTLNVVPLKGGNYV